MAIDLAFTEQGKGTSLIILHGLFGWKRNWARLTKQFTKTHRVTVIDARNHGESPNVPEINYDLMAEDLIQFIETHVESPVQIMGHSMGGKAAMVAALARPNVFEKLIVCDIAPVAYRHSYQNYLKVLKAVNLKNLNRRQEADAVLAQSIPQAHVRGLLLQNLVHNGNEGFQWRVNLDAIAASHDELVAFPEIPKNQKFKGPALFIRGGTSDYVADRYKPRILHLFPSAQIKTVDGAGHWLHAEKPEIFFEKAQTFLNA